MTSRTLKQAVTVTTRARSTAARTRGHVPKHVCRTSEEHSDTVAANPADAFGAGVAVIQRPGALATGAVDVDVSAP